MTPRSFALCSIQECQKGNHECVRLFDVFTVAGVRNCHLCHMEGTYELPLADGLLMTTVRTTGEPDGMDPDFAAVGDARDNVPNPTDWVNSPTASTCFYCHDGMLAVAHIEQNGGSLLVNRDSVTGIETCALCHGEGRSAAVEEVHGLD